MPRWVAAGFLLMALAGGIAEAENARRYSGQVLRIELDRGLVVVEELGARGRPSRHEVLVAPETPIVSAGRLRPRDMRGSNAFAEVPLSLIDVLVGDFVVVESAESEGGAIALRITVVESPRMPRR